jgi:hypothetical protein
LTYQRALLRSNMPSHTTRSQRQTIPPAEQDTMHAAERRHLTRHSLRTPLRFRSTGVAADKSDHFTEALNISRGGFYFASSAPLQVGMPIEVTLRIPGEVSGTETEEMHCTARVVHVRNEAYGDGRIGFGAEIVKFSSPSAAEHRAS